jgi:hypothetical protein
MNTTARLPSDHMAWTSFAGIDSVQHLRRIASPEFVDLLTSLVKPGPATITWIEAPQTWNEPGMDPIEYVWSQHKHGPKRAVACIG